MRFPKADPKGWASPRHVRYFSALYHATPPWLSAEQKAAYREVYRKARKLRRFGRKVSVDHIVPLVSPYVRGLNVPWNLEIVDEKVNGHKGNRFWPGHPHDTVDMFGDRGIAPIHQFSLDLGHL